MGDGWANGRNWRRHVGKYRAHVACRKFEVAGGVTPAGETKEEEEEAEEESVLVVISGNYYTRDRWRTGKPEVNC